MRNLITVFTCFLALQCVSQINTLHTSDWLPASQWRFNPALQSKERVYLILPAIGGFNAQAGHTGFTYDEAVSNNKLELDAIINGLEGTNHIFTSIRTDVFAFGFKAGPVQLRIGSNFTTDFRATYSQDFLQLGWKGNGHEDNIGRRLSMDGTAINAISYLNYFLGASVEVIPEQLTLGANVNFLNGIGLAYTEKSAFGLTTDTDDYTITADGEFDFKTSGQEFDSESFTTSRFLPLSVEGNKGVSIDFGLVYAPSEKFEVAASVVNLGSIKWTEDVKNYELAATEVSYSGFELSDLINSNDTVDIVEQFIDSISDVFIPSENSDVFSAPVNSEYHIQGTLNFSERSAVSLGFSQLSSFGTNFQTIRGVYSKEVRKFIRVHAGLQLFRFKDVMMPIGIVLNAGPVQFGVHTENVLGIINPKSTKYVQGSFSIGLRFGKD